MLSARMKALRTSSHACEQGVKKLRERRSKRPGLGLCTGLGKRWEERDSPGNSGWQEGTSRNQHHFQTSLTLLLLGPPLFC